ncbi:MAG: LamG domain-containing protein [Candidatus Micrarchaeia archaeon]
MIPRHRGSRRGIVLTLDISIAMMVLLAVVALAYATYGNPAREGFDDQLMRSYLQDAATVMTNKGYLSAPTESQNGTNTTGIREVLRATPSTVCMQVSGYGTSVGRDLGGYWKFDEDSGTAVADSSGNGHTGVIYNGGTYSLSSTGKSGHALEADGDDDYVDTGAYFPAMGPQFSILFWVDPDASQANGAGLFGNYESYAGMAFSQGGASANLFGFTYGNGTAAISSDAVQLTAGRWQHVAIVKDENYCYTYINGAQADNSSCATQMAPNPASNLMIARGLSGAAFKGRLDDFRVYSRALSQNEVRLVYSNPSNILYVVDKPECAFSGGEVQSLTVPFVSNLNQEENSYYYATLRAWLSGANK